MTLVRAYPVRGCRGFHPRPVNEEAAGMNANPEISQREPARHVRQIPLDHKMPNSCAFLACSSSCKLPLEDRGSFSGQ